MVTYYQLLKATAVRAACEITYARRATPRQILALGPGAVLSTVGEQAPIWKGETVRALHVTQEARTSEFRALIFTEDSRVAWVQASELEVDAAELPEVPNLNGLRVERSEDGSTLFVLLPRELWRPIAYGCQCQHCTPDHCVPGEAYWDTLAIAVGKTRIDGPRNTTWLTHQPARHGVKAQREET